jgi:hypothetical protein
MLVKKCNFLLHKLEYVNNEKNAPFVEKIRDELVEILEGSNEEVYYHRSDIDTLHNSIRWLELLILYSLKAEKNLRYEIYREDDVTPPYGPDTIYTVIERLSSLLPGNILNFSESEIDHMYESENKNDDEERDDDEQSQYSDEDDDRPYAIYINVKITLLESWDTVDVDIYRGKVVLTE